MIYINSVFQQPGKFRKDIDLLYMVRLFARMDFDKIHMVTL